MLKSLVLKFRPDLSVRLKDVAEKQVPAKLKPKVYSCINSYITKPRYNRHKIGFHVNHEAQYKLY